MNGDAVDQRVRRGYRSAAVDTVRLAKLNGDIMSGSPNLRGRIGSAGEWAGLHLWLILGLWTALCGGLHWPHLAGSWHYFVTGSELLIDPSNPHGGLHLYHFQPQLQIGPLTFLLARPLLLLPAGAAALAAVALMSAGGLLVLRLIGSFVGMETAHERRRLLAAGLLFVPVWSELAARAGHLDDVLALILALAGLLAARSGRPLLTALALAAAADCKPWAVAFLPIIGIATTGDRGKWIGPLAVWAGAIATVWLPFLIADPQTLAAAHFQIRNTASSALRAIGVHTPTTPAWCRPAQAIGGAVIGLALIRRRPAAILFAALGVRLLLDPGTYVYYTAGLLTGAVLVDLASDRSRAPWFTIGAFLAVYLPNYLTFGAPWSPALHGWLRAGYLIVALIAILLTRRPHPTPIWGVGPTTGSGTAHTPIGPGRRDETPSTVILAGTASLSHRHHIHGGGPSVDGRLESRR